MPHRIEYFLWFLTAVRNSLFWFIYKAFILPSFLKGIFAGYFLGWHLLSFKILKMSLYHLHAFIIAIAKPVISLSFVPFEAYSIFLAIFMIFSLSWIICKFTTMYSMHGLLFIYPVWDLLDFLDLWIDVFHQFWKILSH